ncbi:MAG: hypothetical protein HYT94_00735 [Parcubacteria group bacterium]|nr:hypothetical protein [Parcubacteria group bacterium]
MKKPVKTTKIKKVKKMTIEDLALMVARGFENTATKDELMTMKEEMNAQFGEVNEKISDQAKENKDRFDKIEYLLIRALDNRTAKLEDDTRVIKTTIEKMSRA